MRFPVAALFFLIGSFIFFCCWAVSSVLLSEVSQAMGPIAEGLSTDNYGNMLNLFPWAFGVICAIFFIVGLLLLFILDSLSDEPEYYIRR